MGERHAARSTSATRRTTFLRDHADSVRPLARLMESITQGENELNVLYLWSDEAEVGRHRRQGQRCVELRQGPGRGVEGTLFHDQGIL